ncbi:MAG: hypothetical protein HY738_06195 [Bacteroidia bacterium]|nr:hypothetical protein [Bacteroidia bacterium]
MNIDKFIDNYKEYVKRRSFRPFREKDKKGNFKSIKEAALLYSFETYIQAFVQETKGKTYRETDTGLGKSDLLINIKNNEFLIEAKKYYSLSQFTDGKERLAYYCNSLGLKQCIYLVFIKNSIKYPEEVIEQTEKIKNISIKTFLIIYDEEKDF